MSTTQAMRTVVYYGHDDVRVEQRPIPEIGNGEILVKTKACGLCGGETMDWYHRLPKYLGHEPVGEIVEVGSGVNDYKVGDRVFVHHHVACMTCHHCRRGNYTLCDQYASTRIDPAGMAEFFRVPEANLQKDTLLLPENVTDEAGTLIEPFACALKGVRTLGIQPGDTVAVVGAGFIGASYMQLLSFSQAGKIVALDFNDWRIQRAMELGATHGINPNTQRAEAALRDANEGRLADCVVVTAPTTAAWTGAFSLVEKGGTFQAGAPTPPDTSVSIDPNDLYFREVTINSTYSASHRDTAAVLALLAGERLDVDRLITHRFPLEDVQTAVDLLLKAGNSLKSVILP
ncbi:MAG: alcohol dehydrogenase catalytic domain-containing protein [Spirochaetales bacterium]|nr:alcohol dehydrogenase catalytic domain-containing protein [Spirochaetales bacterium]